MIIGNRSTVWADLYQSSGLWHFNVHRYGEQFAFYASKFVDGFAERSDAIVQAAAIIVKQDESAFAVHSNLRNAAQCVVDALDGRIHSTAALKALYALRDALAHE